MWPRPERDLFRVYPHLMTAPPPTPLQEACRLISWSHLPQVQLSTTSTITHLSHCYGNGSKLLYCLCQIMTLLSTCCNRSWVRDNIFLFLSSAVQFWSACSYCGRLLLYPICFKFHCFWASRDVLLHTLVLTSRYLSYCCLLCQLEAVWPSSSGFWHQQSASARELL